MKIFQLPVFPLLQLIVFQGVCGYHSCHIISLELQVQGLIILSPRILEALEVVCFSMFY